jgi:hypothetical protein
MDTKKSLDLRKRMSSRGECLRGWRDLAAISELPTVSDWARREVQPASGPEGYWVILKESLVR